MTFRFYAVPAWQLIAPSATTPSVGAAPHDDEQPLDPSLDTSLLSAALNKVEYRGGKAEERVLQLLREAGPQVYARSPNDLPALLRTADQLVAMAHSDAGEKARTWRCSCGTRYAVPVSLVRPVSLRCENCGANVDLDPTRSEGESAIADPKTASINATRVALSAFFREAMARGWPVLVERLATP